MVNRILFVLLSAFWITMNVLLWRAEYGGHPGLGSTLPARVVWDKILTAPDSSSLTILHKGKKIGFCHWTTSISDDLSKMSSSEAAPEGMVRKIVNYRLELDGNVMLADPSERLRFDAHLTLGKDEAWQAFDLRLNLRPNSWRVQSTATAQAVQLSWMEDAQELKRTFTFAELEHPEAVVQELGGPIAAGLLNSLGVFSAARGAALRTGLKWEARHDAIRLGHSSVQAYRLQAKWLDRFAVVVFVSRVGEILRVELPEGLVLVNDQLGGN